MKVKPRGAEDAVEFPKPELLEPKPLFGPMPHELDPKPQSEIVTQVGERFVTTIEDNDCP
jgi:hypothetical protein